MKPLLGIGMVVALCACAGPGQVHTSLDYNGQSAHTMDPTDPRFYMDDEHGSGAGARPVAVPHYSVDPFCASTCQSRGRSLDSCNRACGF